MASAKTVAQAKSDDCPLVDGVRVRITQKDLDDIEVLELMADIDGGDALKVVPLMRKLFGEDGYTEAKEALRDPATGVATTTAVMEWFGRALEAVGAKN